MFASGDLIQSRHFLLNDIFLDLVKHDIERHFVQDEVVMWLSKATIPQEEHIEMHIWD